MSQCQYLQVPEGIQLGYNCQIKVKTEPDYKLNQCQEIGDMQNRSQSKNKGRRGDRRFKIKTHCYKTQMNEENMQNDEKRLKTSPMKDSPLKQKDQNCSSNPTQRSKKIKLRKINWQNSQESLILTQNKKTSRCKEQKTKVDPRKMSINYSRHKKNSQHSQSKLRQQNLSKSKKKLEVTVFQQRKKHKLTQNKEENEQQSTPMITPIQKQLQQKYSIPYPCTRNIVIDLFQQSRKTSLSKSKSKKRSLSNKSSHNSSTKTCFHKSIKKTDQILINQQKISKTMQKLQQFQIVQEYKNKLQIQNLLKSYILAGQPQCKWTLMVLDKVFQKLRVGKRQ